MTAKPSVALKAIDSLREHFSAPIRLCHYWRGMGSGLSGCKCGLFPGNMTQRPGTAALDALGMLGIHVPQAGQGVAVADALKLLWRRRAVLSEPTSGSEGCPR